MTRHGATHDHDPDGGHGTALVGLVLYGDLEPLMNGARPVELTHGAESMKLLPPYGFPPTKPPSYGVVTQGAVGVGRGRTAGQCLRSFCLATSTTDFPPEPAVELERRARPDRGGSNAGRRAEGVPAAERRSGSCSWRPAMCRAV